MDEDAEHGESQRYCTECGSPVSPTARFCGNCGHELRPILTDPDGAEEASSAGGTAVRTPTGQVPVPRQSSPAEPMPASTPPDPDPEPEGGRGAMVAGIVIACVAVAVVMVLIGWWIFAGAGGPGMATSDVQADAVVEDGAATQPEGEAAEPVGGTTDQSADQAAGESTEQSEPEAVNPEDEARQESARKYREVVDAIQGWWDTTGNRGGYGQIQFAGNEAYDYWFQGGTGESSVTGPYALTVLESDDGTFWYITIDTGYAQNTYLYYPDDPDTLYLGTEAGPASEGELLRSDGPDERFAGLR